MRYNTVQRESFKASGQVCSTVEKGRRSEARRKDPPVSRLHFESAVYRRHIRVSRLHETVTLSLETTMKDKNGNHDVCSID